MSKESCTCKVCKEMCNRPCWPLPSEAEALIENGYASKLMLDYYVVLPEGDICPASIGYLMGSPLDELEGDIYLLCPASIGYEGRTAPYMPGKCCLQDSNGLCVLHDLGLKPCEGREVHCGQKRQDNENLHEWIAFQWNSPEGKRIIRLWKSLVDKS